MNNERVYLIGSSYPELPVKIGYSQNPALRLDQIEIWSPVPLKVIASFRGDREIEKRVHQKFIHLHSHGEWFKPASEIFLFFKDAEAASTLGALLDFSEPVIGLGETRRRSKDPEYPFAMSYKTRLGQSADKLQRLGSSDRRLFRSISFLRDEIGTWGVGGTYTDTKPSAPVLEFSEHVFAFIKSQQEEAA